MPRSFAYNQDLDVFNVEPSGALVTRFFRNRGQGEGWERRVLAGPGRTEPGTDAKAVPHSGISIVRDYQVAGRIDGFAEADGDAGGIIHVWFVPGSGWTSEHL